jgi:hypothetical protein
MNTLPIVQYNILATRAVCRNTIFYTPQPVTAFDVQRIYTHFAMVVSVDQCARTCHEFNCDVS